MQTHDSGGELRLNCVYAFMDYVSVYIYPVKKFKSCTHVVSYLNVSCANAADSCDSWRFAAIRGDSVISDTQRKWATNDNTPIEWSTKVRKVALRQGENTHCIVSLCLCWLRCVAMHL